MFARKGVNVDGRIQSGAETAEGQQIPVGDGGRLNVRGSQILAQYKGQSRV